MNDYAMYRSQERQDSGVYKRWNVDTHLGFTDILSNPIRYNPSDYSETASVQSRALRNLYGNAPGSDLQVGVALAEGKKTFGLVADTAIALGSAFRHLRRGDVYSAMRDIGINDVKKANRMRKSLTRDLKEGAGKVTDIAGSRWLELQYGWRPLVSDVYSAATLLHRGFDDDGADIVVRGSSQRKIPLKRRTSTLMPDVSVTGKMIYRYQYVVQLRVIQDSLRAANSLGLINPASVAWELIPYSFVVDWFVPIGEWINSVTAFAGTTVVDACRTESYSVDGKADSGRFRTTTYDKWYDENLTYEYKKVRVLREKLYSIPSFGHAMASHHISEAFSWSHVITSLALLRSSFH
jgi:hypothetical protein